MVLKKKKHCRFNNAFCIYNNVPKMSAHIHYFTLISNLDMGILLYKYSTWYTKWICRKNEPLSFLTAYYNFCFRPN